MQGKCSEFPASSRQGLYVGGWLTSLAVTDNVERKREQCEHLPYTTAGCAGGTVFSIAWTVTLQRGGNGGERGWASPDCNSRVIGQARAGDFTLDLL